MIIAPLFIWVSSMVYDRNYFYYAPNIISLMSTVAKKGYEKYLVVIDIIVILK